MENADSNPVNPDTLLTQRTVSKRDAKTVTSSALKSMALAESWNVKTAYLSKPNHAVTNPAMSSARIAANASTIR